MKKIRLTAMAAALVFLGGAPTMALANKKIDACLKVRNCLFQLRGFATPNPTMTFIVTKKVWAAFTEKDKDDLRSELKQRVEDTRNNPERYIEIPASAPFYRKAIENTKTTTDYSVILSRDKSPGGELSIDEEILRNF